jgi:hypothetical protein
VKVTTTKLGVLSLFRGELKLMRRLLPATATLAPGTFGANPAVPINPRALAGRVKVKLSTRVAVFKVSKKLKGCDAPCVMPDGDSRPSAPGVELAVALGVMLAVAVAVLVGVIVELLVGVSVLVKVGVSELLGVAVEVWVGVAVTVGVTVKVGVSLNVRVGQCVMVQVLV